MEFAVSAFEMNEERKQMDARELNLRQEEGPFMTQKRALEEKEALLEDRDLDLCDREAEFRKRLDESMKEIRELKLKHQNELEALQEKRATLETEYVQFKV